MASILTAFDPFLNSFHHLHIALGSPFRDIKILRDKPVALICIIYGTYCVLSGIGSLYPDTLGIYLEKSIPVVGLRWFVKILVLLIAMEASQKRKEEELQRKAEAEARKIHEELKAKKMGSDKSDGQTHSENDNIKTPSSSDKKSSEETLSSIINSTTASTAASSEAGGEASNTNSEAGYAGDGGSLTYKRKSYFDSDKP